MGARILVVEDEESYRILTERALRRSGYDDLRFAGTVSDAKLALEQEPFDLVLLDWFLPGGTGGDIALWIRNYLKKPDMPLILLTAMEQSKEDLLGLGSDIDDCLPKPFEPKALITRVEFYLKKKT